MSKDKCFRCGETRYTVYKIICTKCNNKRVTSNILCVGRVHEGLRDERRCSNRATIGDIYCYAHKMKEAKNCGEEES